MYEVKETNVQMF